MPTCPASGLLVTFQPGTYTDAQAMSNLMNGGCPGRLFWFAPGTYYFNFSNNAGLWQINDAGARDRGWRGQRRCRGRHADRPGHGEVRRRWPTRPPAHRTATRNTGNARLIGETPTALSATTGNFNTSNQTRWISSTGYAISPQIPGGATGISVNARIVHSETFGNPSQVGSLQLLVRNQADTATLCTVPVTPSATSGAGTDATVALPAACGLDQNALNNGTFTLRYQVTHSTCGGSPACANISSSLDGIELQVSYTTSARAAWDPSNPATVTASSPAVPGACVHDGDYGFNAEQRRAVRLRRQQPRGAAARRLGAVPELQLHAPGDRDVRRALGHGRHAGRPGHLDAAGLHQRGQPLHQPGERV